jgi:hypothetical protein
MYNYENHERIVFYALLVLTFGGATSLDAVWMRSGCVKTEHLETGEHHSVNSRLFILWSELKIKTHSINEEWVMWQASTRLCVEREKNNFEKYARVFEGKMHSASTNR